MNLSRKKNVKIESDKSSRSKNMEPAGLTQIQLVVMVIFGSSKLLQKLFDMIQHSCQIVNAFMLAFLIFPCLFGCAFHMLADLPGDTSPERRVLYKLISGLHSSISVHIAREYLLDEEKNLVSYLHRFTF